MIKVLYVDDSPDDRDILRISIARLSDDIRVRPAASAAEAIQTIRSEKPDCIVSDLDMPGMNGLELLRTLRNSGDNTPFIFFSCHDYTDLTELALLAGAHSFEVKGPGKKPLEKLMGSIREVAEESKEDRRANIAGPENLALSTWT
ncbi:MAG TPA: response regulator [Acidobacteriota bacterium]|nr:response regulator [Acidobacteriota bacterium]